MDSSNYVASEKGKLLTYHGDLARHLGEWYAVRDALIEEVHAKKSILKRKKYQITSKVVQHVYDNLLFQGAKKGLGMGFSPEFIEIAMDLLPDVAVRECDIKLIPMIESFEITSVYYGGIHRKASINKEAWRLSDGPELTPEDCQTFARYCARFTLFADEIVTICNVLPRARSRVVVSSRAKLAKAWDTVQL